ncbi:MAG TPA: plastocyanin/azurin family copper-binding protein, partial [Bacteroidota bacterium]|nr:plastocyanin/azurin family copper-binding protein [Bacteroidota bacterium]
MKFLFLFIALSVISALPSQATTHTVTAVGFTFSPSSLTITAGDTVIFSISGIHNAVEVSQATWDANGTTPLGGGFSLPLGGGSVVLTVVGTHWYVCQPHASSGMKGIITVNPTGPPPSTITINSVADQDGLTGTTGDRIPKKWSLKLYQDSVGSGVVLDSVNSAATLNVTGLAAGTYVAVEADSVSWTHFSITADGVPQGVTAQKFWPFTIGSGENHTVTFFNTAPNMIISNGFTFAPDTLTVDNGDTVFFVLETIHTAREVSRATWEANGTASNGGFDLPTGGGTYIPPGGGIDYYVCVPHAGSGMKGLIMVNPIPPSTITLRSFADQDGNHVTTADRLGKAWGLKLYQDSVGSGIVVDSVVSGDSLVVPGLPPGHYVAAEDDSSAWSHVSLVVNGSSQGATAQSSWAFTVGSAENQSVDFLNHVPNMIINVGFTFSPDTLVVDSGATVYFVLDPIHNAREVDSSVWVANDTVSNGGFDLPFAGGSAVINKNGSVHYVCVPHAGSGMKGLIIGTVEPSHGVLIDTVADGWNLLSLPFGTDDSSVAALYPTALSQAFIYSGGYQARSAVSTGEGYWIKFGGSQPVNLDGSLLETDTVGVSPGWNIIGSVSVPFAVISIQSDPGGLVTSSIALDGD